MPTKLTTIAENREPSPIKFHLDRRASGVADAMAQGGDPDALLSTEELAQLAGTSTQFFEGLRGKGVGPPFVKLSARRVRYRRADVIEWLRERTFQSTAKYADGYKPQGRKRGARVVDGRVISPAEPSFSRPRIRRPTE